MLWLKIQRYYVGKTALKPKKIVKLCSRVKELGLKLNNVSQQFNTLQSKSLNSRFLNHVQL